MAGHLGYEVFKRHTGDKFSVDFDPIGEQELVLSSVEDRSNAMCETFSIIFTGMPEMLLPQQTHRFKHLTIGEFEIFITPVLGSSQQEIRYQALFNRLK